MYSISKAIFVVIIVSLLSACSITQKVDQIPQDTTIDKVWIENNPTAKHDNFDEEMAATIRNLGFESEVFPKNQLPADSTYIMKYYVRWQWDMAVYLREFRASLYENHQEIGSVVYDASAGGANMNKFGKTMNKVNPLLEELLGNAKPGKPIKAEQSHQATTSIESNLQKLKELYSKKLITEHEYTQQKQRFLEEIN